jgi:hypothetical protein
MLRDSSWSDADHIRLGHDLNFLLFAHILIDILGAATVERGPATPVDHEKNKPALALS